MIPVHYALIALFPVGGKNLRIVCLEHISASAQGHIWISENNGDVTYSSGSHGLDFD
jgi:hypothetical protein